MSSTIKPFGQTYEKYGVNCVTLQKLYYDLMKMNALDLELEELLNNEFSQFSMSIKSLITNFNIFDSVYDIVNFIYSTIPYMDEKIIASGNVKSYTNVLVKRNEKEISQNTFMIIPAEEFIDIVQKQFETNYVLYKFNFKIGADILSFVDLFMKDITEKHKLSRSKLSDELKVNIASNNSERIIILRNYCLNVIYSVYQTYYTVILNTLNGFAYTYSSIIIDGVNYIEAKQPKVSFVNHPFYKDIVQTLEDIANTSNIHSFLEYMKERLIEFYKGCEERAIEYQSSTKLFEEISYQGQIITSEEMRKREVEENYNNAKNIVSEINELLSKENDRIINLSSFSDTGFTIRELEKSVNVYSTSTFFLFYIKDNLSDSLLPQKNEVLIDNKIISFCLIEEENIAESVLIDTQKGTREKKTIPKTIYIQKIFTDSKYRQKSFGKNILYSIVKENPKFDYVASVKLGSPYGIESNYKKVLKFFYNFNFVPYTITYDLDTKVYEVELKSYYDFTDSCLTLRSMNQKIDRVEHFESFNKNKQSQSEWNNNLIRFIEFMNQGFSSESVYNSLSLFHYLDYAYTEHLIETFFYQLNQVSFIKDFYCKINFDCSKSKNADDYREGFVSSYKGVEFDDLKPFSGQLYKFMINVSSEFPTNYIAIYNQNKYEKNLFLIFKPLNFIYESVVYTIKQFCLSVSAHKEFNLYLPTSVSDDTNFKVLLSSITDALGDLVLYFNVTIEDKIPCFDEKDYYFIKLSYDKATTKDNFKSSEEFKQYINKIRIETVSTQLKHCKYTVLFNASELRTIKDNYINESVEWGGIWRIKKMVVKKGKQESLKYVLYNRKDFKGDVGTVNIPEQSFVYYHTHPYSTYRNFLTFNTPSSADLTSTIIGTKIYNQIMNIVITVEGVYFVTLSDKFKYYLKTLSDDCLRYTTEFVKTKFKKELEPYNIIVENLNLITFLKQETIDKINTIKKIYFGKIPINETTKDISKEFVYEFINYVNSLTFLNFPNIADALYQIKDKNDFYNICNFEPDTTIFNIKFMTWDKIYDAERNNEILTYDVSTYYSPSNESCPYYDTEEVVRTLVKVRTSSMYLRSPLKKTPEKQLDILIPEVVENRISSIKRDLSDEFIPESKKKKSSSESRRGVLQTKKILKNNLEDTTPALVDKLTEISILNDISPQYIATSLKKTKTIIEQKDTALNKEVKEEFAKERNKMYEDTLQKSKSIIESEKEKVSIIEEDIEGTQEYDI